MYSIPFQRPCPPIKSTSHAKRFSKTNHTTHDDIRQCDDRRRVHSKLSTFNPSWRTAFHHSLTATQTRPRPPTQHIPQRRDTNPSYPSRTPAQDKTLWILCRL